ncbi:MAG: 16S rRNA (cytidine(1402)-2'-O)-methyltransferase [Desulfosalsimonadaceae bacterium]
MTDKQARPRAGTLYIVATPIGNLADITLRALEILESVDLIAAEDTRHSRRLLSHYNISARLLSCHEHNESERARELVQRLAGGESVALLSDAGTPAVSDPGYRILQETIEADIAVVPIPGACAAMAALSAAGMETDAFFFVGFLPQKGAKRSTSLAELAKEPATLIFYESPNRLVQLLHEILELMGDRRVVVAREMTKRHEEFLRGRASEVVEVLAGREAVKGEVTLLVSGKKGGDKTSEQELRRAVAAALETDSGGGARLARELSGRFGVPRNRIYDIILELKSE